MAVSRVLSIEITDMTTHVCEIGYNKKNPTIYKSIIFENPQFSVEDGFVLNRGIYKNALKDAIDAAKIKTRDTVFALASNKIINREVIIPEMKPELISGLIENERNEYFPMDTNGYLFAFEILEKIKETKQQRITVYAAPEILIKNITALAGELDLNIVAIDYAGNAIYQWLKRPTHDPIEMYLQINEKNSQFTILDEGKLELQRNMNFGVNTLVNVMNTTRYFEGELEYNDALLKLKEQKLLFSSFNEVDTVVPEDEAERKLNFVKSQLTDATRPMIGNISSVLEYYNTKKRGAIMRGRETEDVVEERRKRRAAAGSDEDLAGGSGAEGAEEGIITEAEEDAKKLARIYLGGAGTNVQGFKELIENEFNGIEVIVLDALPGLNIAKDNPVAENHSTELIACIGASYPSINFFRKSTKEALSKTLILSIVALVIVIAAAVIIILNGKMEYDKAVDAQQALTAKRDELEAGGIEQLENEFYAAQARYGSVEEADKSTFNHNENWNEVLSYLESESVSDIIVTSVTSTSDTLTMNVTVNSKESAAKLLMQLQQIPYFSDVAISAISESEDDEIGVKVISFSVQCKYQQPVEEETTGEGE
ncbi:MAG: pilus assembly protein PilM [Lachnospiraceae bacterium]|nr:pilus assembly protein PilM [Lachnospiraceae bacterium]